ncbi:MAG: zinc ABC transporter substrate-binding protein [Tissierellia bacterium]|nr:zinc ABC transporter substrate-binding protein [Tissierellia bacterium]
MKKFLIIILSLILMTSVLVACQKEDTTNSGNQNTESLEPNKEVESSEEKKTVTVTTSFLYDMVNQLAGDFVNREVIIPAGEDPHLYIAKPNDLQKLTEADMVLYHGLHFEGKMVDALEKVGFSVSEDFPKDALGTMDQDGEIITDPHFWFNIDLYKMATEKAAFHLKELVPEHSDEIDKNLETYLAQLDELYTETKEKISAIPKEQRFLITPHDAFNYFSRAYDIPVMAPQGVSTDSEVANKDIQDTVDFIVENKVKAIFAESTTDPARMEKLKEACKNQGFDVKVVSGEGNELFSDSLAAEGEYGDNFLDMYRHNVDLIAENLK